MGKSLQVIALISGGKDSLFSILHCIANGHQVVALANLYPAPTKAGNDAVSTGEESVHEDLDSYMYQTVGHIVIPLYSEALEIPLYRREIIGTAVNEDKSYPPDGVSGDETESLILLLHWIKLAHPTANALSSGAILSDYQRTRVESLAIRLGLTPLSYLWQYPSLHWSGNQITLLQDMAAVGQDSRIIKTASGGLDETFLWENVADIATEVRLIALMGRFTKNYEGVILGEGGEYETLTIDGPAPLWKRAIQIFPTEREVVNLGSGSTMLKILGARLVPKPAVTDRDEPKVRIPTLFDPDFLSILNSWDEASLPGVPSGDGNDAPQAPSGHALPFKRLAWSNPVATSSSTYYVSNMVSSGHGPDVAAQTAAIVRGLRQLLEKKGPNASIVFSLILLSSMENFAAVNSVYATMFRQANPPARVTVGVGSVFPFDIEVSISVIIDLGPPSMRSGLHVQSRSYWAPANIGPYSQAQAVIQPDPYGDEALHQVSIVYVAGQIPLEPSTMEPFGQDLRRIGPRGNNFPLRVILALQHLWRIGSTMEVVWWLSGVAFFTAETDIRSKAQIAWEAWRARHAVAVRERQMAEAQDGAVEIDIWEDVFAGPKKLAAKTPPKHQLPNLEAVDFRSSGYCPAFFAVQVAELPRGCDIEWAAVGLKSGNCSVDEKTLVNGLVHVFSCQVSDMGAAFVHFSISSACTFAEFGDALRTIFALENLPQPLQTQKQMYAVEQMTLYTSRPVGVVAPLGLVIVPCRSVWGREGEELAAGIVARVSLRH